MGVKWIVSSYPMFENISLLFVFPDRSSSLAISLSKTVAVSSWEPEEKFQFSLKIDFFHKIERKKKTKFYHWIEQEIRDPPFLSDLKVPDARDGPHLQWIWHLYHLRRLDVINFSRPEFALWIYLHSHWLVGVIWIDNFENIRAWRHVWH